MSPAPIAVHGDQPIRFSTRNENQESQRYELPEFQCVYSAGELASIWVLYSNRRLLRRTRLFVDELAVYVRDEM